MIKKIILPYDLSDKYYLTFFSNNVVEYYMSNNIYYIERFIDNKFYGFRLKRR